MENVIMTSIGIEELQSIITACIQREFQKINVSEHPTVNAEELLSRQEASNLLKISKVTLSKYVKSGKVKAHRIDRKVYFKRNELYRAFRKMTFKAENHG